MAEEQTAFYVSDRHPNLRGAYFTGEGEEKKRHKFELKSGSMTLSDPEHIAGLDREIKSRPALSAVLRRIDVSAAEEVAKQHQKDALRKTRGFKGPFTSDARRDITGEERIHAALGAEAGPETVAQVQEALAEQGLEVPEDTTPVQQIPDPTEPVAPEDAVKMKEQATLVGDKKKAFLKK